MIASAWFRICTATTSSGTGRQQALRWAPDRSLDLLFLVRVLCERDDLRDEIPHLAKHRIRPVCDQVPEQVER